MAITLTGERVVQAAAAFAEEPTWGFPAAAEVAGDSVLEALRPAVSGPEARVDLSGESGSVPVSGLACALLVTN